MLYYKATAGCGAGMFVGVSARMRAAGRPRRSHPVDIGGSFLWVWCGLTSPPQPKNTRLVIPGFGFFCPLIGLPSFQQDMR